MANWLSTLLTTTPTQGFELAFKLARMATKATQPDTTVPTGLVRVMPRMRIC